MYVNLKRGNVNGTGFLPKTSGSGWTVGPAMPARQIPTAYCYHWVSLKIKLETFEVFDFFIEKLMIML